MLMRKFLPQFYTFRSIVHSFAEAKTSGPNLQSDFSQMADAQNTKSMTTGRAWRTQQLRLKSNEDLHKLWYVCVKQKNILLADRIIERKYSENDTLNRRITKVKSSMNRILGVVKEREIIKRAYRTKLQNEYIEKKREELRQKVAKEQEILPEITWQMLRQKYLQLRRGIDNVKYLEKIYEKQEEFHARKARMEERLKTNRPYNFKSFWDYQMTIGERPLQEQVLRAHVRNWKSLNLKQRKIVLGFLNAKRSKDAKASFIKELRILGDKIAQDQIKERISSAQSKQ